MTISYVADILRLHGKNSRIAMPTKQTESAPSFLQVYTQVLRDRMKHSFLRQISTCVDWRGIRTLLNKKYTKTQNATGNPAYDALMMFKILLLQTWYGLSDYEVEERINDSLLFSEFLLLDMGLPAPDHSTICRFRAELTRLGIMDKLLRELNKQFKKHEISRIDQGAIVDASIVDSPHAPDGSILIEVADDREDLHTEEEQAQEQAYQYELKSCKPELIEKAELTQGVSVRADKGYCSKKNSACLLERGLIDGIMLKAQKGMKLTERQREFNNLISKTRCLIERTFGSI